MQIIPVKGYGKIFPFGTTEILFCLYMHGSYTHAVFKNTKCLATDGQVCFYGRLFSDTAIPKGYILGPGSPLKCINRTDYMGTYRKI